MDNKISAKEARELAYKTTNEYFSSELAANLLLNDIFDKIKNASVHGQTQLIIANVDYDHSPMFDFNFFHPRQVASGANFNIVYKILIRELREQGYGLKVEDNSFIIMWDIDYSIENEVDTLSKYLNICSKK